MHILSYAKYYNLLYDMNFRRKSQVKRGIFENASSAAYTEWRVYTSAYYKRCVMQTINSTFYVPIYNILITHS